VSKKNKTNKETGAVHRSGQNAKEVQVRKKGNRERNNGEKCKRKWGRWKKRRVRGDEKRSRNTKPPLEGQWNWVSG